MPKLEECLINVDLALALRDIADAMHLKIPYGSLKLRCPNCKQPVKPHKQGEGPDGIDGPHFEHIEGYAKKKCQYRHKQPQ